MPLDTDKIIPRLSKFLKLKNYIGLVVSSPKIQECSWAEAIFTEISSWLHNQTLGDPMMATLIKTARSAKIRNEIRSSQRTRDTGENFRFVLYASWEYTI